jgi:hypothetical protein
MKTETVPSVAEPGEEVVNMRFNSNLLARIDAMIATTTTSDPTPRRGAGTMILREVPPCGNDLPL